ncbi:MAG: hypothetical protein WBP85_12210 [Terracidiphilus sp.]
MATASLSYSLHSSEDSIDLRGQAKKCRDYIFALQEISLAKLYAESRLSVMLDLCLKRDDFPVRCKAASEDHAPMLNSSIFMLEFYAVERSHCDHRDEQMVFIVNVELMEGQNIAVPSLVRFHAIDNQVVKGGGSWYFSSNSGPKIVFGLERVNREFAELGIVAGNKCSIGPAPGNIQSAMEIVDCIAHHQSQVSGQCAIRKAIVEELFPRFSVNVQAGAVTVGRGIKSLIDFRDVLLGSLDF